VDIQIPLTSLLPPRPEIKGLTQLIAQLKPGQHIEAVVESHIGENYYVLRLQENGLHLKARTQQQLQPGDVLKLRVEQAGDTPTLKMLSHTPPPADAANTVLRAASKELLPRQLPAQTLIDTLNRLLETAATGSKQAALPPVIQASLQRLVQTLPAQTQLATADGLKKAMDQSGIFLEARLAKAVQEGKNWEGGDFKGRLLAVSATIAKQLRDAEEQQPPSPDEPAMDLAESYDLPLRQGTPSRSRPAHTDAAPSPATKDAPPSGNREPPAKTQTAAQPPTAEVSIPRADTGQIKIAGDSDAAELAPPPVSFAMEPELQADSEAPPVPVTGQTVSSKQENVKQEVVVIVTGETELRHTAQPDPHEGSHPAPQGSSNPAETTKVPSALSDGSLHELKSQLHRTEGVLANITLGQMASLPQQDDRQALWQFAIPYLHAEGSDVALLTIIREGKRGDAAAQNFWSVDMELHPPGLGTLHARITLIAGSIDSYFWSDRDETARLVNSNLDRLAAQLQHAGLAIGRLGVLPAAPNSAEKSNPQMDFPLLDENA
jgi:flagellar hook-length control protein FliK